MDKPKISVVMPVYNGEQFVEQAIRSILDQDFSDFELIIVDDYSTDKAISKIEQIKDKRIHLVKNRQNIGNYASRNIGNTLAKGKYIAVMDADDISLSNRLSTQFEYLEGHPKIGLLGSFGQFIKNNEKGDLIENPIDFTKIKVALLRENCFIHSSMMYRVSFLKKHHIKYNSLFTYGADYEFAYRCSKKFKIENLPEVLTNYRIHSNQISIAKREEQTQFANEVRLAQMRQFKLNCSEEERNLHLKLMRLKLSIKSDSEKIINWCNKILAANSKQRVYHHIQLYDYLALLIKAQSY